jgi:hypothetical protein
MLPASTLVTRQSPSNLDRYSDGSSVVLFCCGLIGSVSFSHSYEIETLFPNHLYVTALHPYIVKASCEHSSCGRRYAFMAFVILLDRGWG